MHVFPFNDCFLATPPCAVYQKEYDDKMGELARRYLEDHPEPRVFGFLHATFAELWDHFGGVYGVTLPQPKMVPVAEGQ